jgi:hypothetical protein
MKKFLVITAITDGKDKLIDPPVVFKNCDYIAYVDKKEDDVKVWEQRDILKFSTIDDYKNRREAKTYKILSSLMFPQYEYIIWEDGNHQLKKDPQLIIDEYGDDVDVFLFKHPDRKCLYQEMTACAQWNLDIHDNLQNQFTLYKSLRMPDRYGLYEMCTFIVKTTHAVKELQLMWWEQITKFSSRDQISFPFCLWRMEKKLKIKKLRGYANKFTLQGEQEDNEYFVDQGRHLKY